MTNEPDKNDTPETPPNTATPPEPKAEDKGSEKTFTRDEVNEIVKERLERENKKRVADAEKLAKEAEEKAAKDRGEWEKVAHDHEATIADLTKQLEEMNAVKAEIDRVNKALDEQLKVDRKNLPAHIIELLDKLSQVDQLMYIAKNRATFTAQNGNVNLPKTPDSNGVDKTITDEEIKRRKAEATQFLRNSL